MFKNLITVLFMVGVITACSKQVDGDGSSSIDAAIISAQTTVIQLQDVPSYVEVAGTLEGQQVIPVATKLMSEITYMGFEEGQRVNRGDILARIDDSDISAMRSEAAAFRAEAVGVMAEVEAAIAQGEASVMQTKAGLAQAVAANADAQADAKRFRTLVGESVVAPMQAAKYELAAEVANENVALAEAAISAARSGVSQAESKVPQVQAKQNQAAAKDAQAAALQEYATLTAPFDGVVTARFADPGQLAIPGQPLYNIVDDSGFRVILAVAENVAAGLAVGQSTDVVIDSVDGQQDFFTGTIVVVGGAADPATHTVRVEVSLDVQAGLLSGRFARVLIPSGAKQALFVPQSAIVHDGGLTSVWRVSDSGLANKVPVDIGLPKDGKIEVFRGLSSADNVIIVPTDEIFAGARVHSGSNNSGE